MKKINIISSKRKIRILIIAAVILLAASQWWSIRMVYTKKLHGNIALTIAKIYHLKAGSVNSPSGNLQISLYDYMKDYSFTGDYLRKQAVARGQEFTMTDEQLKETVWEKVLRQVWVNNLAVKNKIKINNQDIVDFYDSIGGKDSLLGGLKKGGVDASKYESLVVRPSIIEAKTYKFLLDNFNDLAGMQKAQNAYKALVDDKKKFEDVAKDFSDDMTYVDTSMFVDADQLGEFGEPIKQLKPGEYSKIMTLPGDPGYYIIWLLRGNSVNEETKKEVKELRGIAIRAKSMDDFYADWKNNSKINQWYK